jgi:hypothetical protein
MLLGVYASHGVLPLEFKPACSVGDLVLQHLDVLEQESERNRGILQVLIHHFAQTFRIPCQMPLTMVGQVGEEAA